MGRTIRKYRKKLICLSGALIFCLALKTYIDVSPVQSSLHSIISDAQTLQVTDRNGRPLTVSYQNRWNTYDNLPLHKIPEFLKSAFILSEDKRFYQHDGIDWRARTGALWQNMHAGHVLRGASTITEQVVRMINPRPRNWWSKWIETFEAISLENRFSKADILEFYLNQVPYASNRRGLLQASRYYFNRDLSTLNHKEMLALVVLARAPSSFDLYKNSEKINAAIDRLAELLAKETLIDQQELAALKEQEFTLNLPDMPINATHFVSYVRQHASAEIANYKIIKTTLDADLQRDIQQIIDERVKNLRKKSLHNAAALVVDHTTGEILTWIVAGAENQETPAGQIDAVTAPRQPGSALKPFLYTAALQSGWSPATIIDDSPLAEAIGTGLHRFKNYSNTYYGKISLREALGNSLNIPALHTIQHVGTQHYLSLLHALGFASLDRGADIYDEGLALGNGEVTLLELVQGYTTLAHLGVYRPLEFLLEGNGHVESRRVFSEEVTSLIANILSDPWARRLEFGNNSVLNLPVQTAAKTGTSTDYLDAWAIGFNDRYVVGIWMGNLDHTPTDGVTGSAGPALALRSVFARLNQHRKTEPLFLSPKLVKQDLCVSPDDEPNSCFMRTEYFISGTEPSVENKERTSSKPELARPTDGLLLAFDPRIPQDRQKFEFQIIGIKPGDSVDWLLNDELLAHTDGGKYLWNLERGKYKLRATINRIDASSFHIPEIAFIVK